MRFFFIAISFWMILPALAQKKLIDEDTYSRIVTVVNEQISNSGDIIVYNLLGPGYKESLVIKSIDSSYQMEFPKGVNALITDDSRFVVFGLSDDSLCILNLLDRRPVFIPKVSKFQLIGSDKQQKLAYQQENRVYILSINSQKQKIVYNVDDFLCNKQSQHIIVRNNDTLFSYDLKMSMKKILYVGAHVRNWKFDEEGKKFACFFYDESQCPAIFYNNFSAPKGVNVLNLENRIDTIMYSFNYEYIGFCTNSNKLVIKVDLKKKSLSKLEDLPSLDVWSYKDSELQSTQLNRIQNEQESFYSIVDLNSDSIQVIEQSGYSFINLDSFDDYIIQYKPRTWDGFFDVRGWPVLRIYSLAQNKIDTIVSGISKDIQNVSVSPNGQYVVWYDVDRLNYYSYEIASKKIRNISELIPSPVYDADVSKIGINGSLGIAGWSEDKAMVFIYDKFDIWEVDLDAKKKPINITNHSGEKNRLVLSFADLREGTLEQRCKDKILSAFDPITKMNGYMALSKGMEIEKRAMGPYIYSIVRIGNGNMEYHSAGPPIRAKFKNVYLVKRMSAISNKNLYVTKDFVHYRQMTFIEPMEEFNWLTNELINWALPDGTISQGILYKPENFDSLKQYPVIFDIYEKRSNQLNEFLLPEYNGQRINIPTYVSNGYLVFVPDIYYPQKKNGEGIVNSIVTAINALRKFPFIDTTKIGVQGHSFGGWEVNYLITHSKVFTAACEASGAVNLISCYGQLNGNGTSRQLKYETTYMGSPYGFGVTPWTDSTAYISNSPIFGVRDISTPLLMMHNIRDGSVPFSQAVEFFTALRRAGKKVWMLQYDGFGHYAPAKDFSIRMMQFFNYYLKGIPPPSWMTNGISAEMKGVKDGLELDHLGKP